MSARFRKCYSPNQYLTVYMSKLKNLSQQKQCYAGVSLSALGEEFLALEVNKK